MSAKSYEPLDTSRLFVTPFSRDYWRLAVREFSSLRVLLLAAILTAMRIGIKAFRVPLGPDLNLTFGFLVNAVGSMIYGPVVAIAASAVSDTVGAVLFPSGAYFFPYIFTEIAGGLLFALFLYRARLSVLRVMLARFSVTVVCNLVLDRLFYMWQNYLLTGKTLTFMTWPRLVKNIVTFPLQTVLLVLLLRSLVPVTTRMKLTHADADALQFTKRDIVLLVVLSVIAVPVIVAYYIWRG